MPVFASPWLDPETTLEERVEQAREAQAEIESGERQPGEPTTVAEPVVPVVTPGFTPPPDSDPISWVWKKPDTPSPTTANLEELRAWASNPDKTKPTAYQDKAGEIYYTPYNVEWLRGFETQSQRLDTELGNVPAPFVAIKTSRGLFHVTRKEAEALERITDPEQKHWQLKQLGIIDPNETYISPEQVAKTVAMRETAGDILEEFANTDGSLNFVRATNAVIEGDKEVYQALLDYGYSNPDIIDTVQSLKELKQQNEGLYNTLIEKGYGDYKSEVQLLNDNYDLNREQAAEFAREHTLLKDGAWINNNELEKLKANNPNQADYLMANGYEAYKERLIDAEDLLSYYNDGQGNYDIREAVKQSIFDNDPETGEAVEFLFPSLAVATVMQDLAFQNIPAGETYRDRERKLREKLEDMGISVSEDAPILTEGTPPETLQERLENLGLSREQAGLLTASTVAAGIEPTPIGEIAILAILGGFVAAKTIEAAFDQYREQTGKEASTDDIVIVTNQGAASKLKDVLPAGQQGIPPYRPIKLDMGDGTSLTPPVLNIPQGTKLIPPLIDKATGDIKPTDIETALLIYPQSKPEDVFDNQGGILQAQAVEAKEKLDIVIDKIAETGVNLPQVVAKTETQLQKPEELARAFSEINRVTARSDIAPELSRSLRRAYEDYINRLRLLYVARQQFVATLNPQPIYGEVTDRTLAALAQLKMAQGLSEQTAASIRTAARMQSQVGVTPQTATSEVTQTVPRVQAKAQPRAATQARTATQTKTATQAKTATQTRAATRTATKTATGEATATAEAVTTAEAAQARTIDTPPPPPPPPMPLPHNAGEKKKRAFLKKVPGFVVRRRGELNGQSVWKVNYFPYGEDDELVLLGKPPQGVKNVTGPGSVKKSATLIRGKQPTKPIYDDTGAVDDIISPSGTGIKVQSVRDRFNKRRSRISPRGSRISPKRSRISR